MITKLFLGSPGVHLLLSMGLDVSEYVKKIKPPNIYIHVHTHIKEREKKKKKEENDFSEIF